MDVTADFEGHDNLFERCIAGTFSNAVHGALYLTGTVFKSAERVCHGKAKVVMAMDTYDCTADVLDSMVKIGNFFTELGGPGIAGSVGDIDGCCSCGDDCLDDFGKEALIGAAGIFGGKLDIGGECFCKGNSIDSHVQDGTPLILKGCAVSVTGEFAGNVDIGGADEGVNARFAGLGKCFPCGSDIALYRSG